MKVVSYRCSVCDAIFTLSYKDDEKINFNTSCKECNGLAVRLFTNVVSTIEDENITAAKEIMKFSKLPSGTTKRAI
jgi:DNA-directed RNA polymerase subunit RPC12/RpoP